ncbi:hypothetical protein [Sedimentitalea nanhaiensis]|uniref:Uncharacterized protein n=1 Tax=Sedimentitalea nanhaiensis TaxID=999627 RepID=A0A1I7DWD6_9RHOB|nr:hypothetical protein [Sedimentitalea nanhaiensis]SFU15936.1 hypothetical protein SAMN05216236_13624 [Sedimentitalea nanhaiensis]
MSLYDHDTSSDTADYRRPATEVMRLARMGSSHPTRLSFLRVLLRRLASGDWDVDRPVWAVDAKGVGHAVYRVRGAEQTYSLVAFSHDLPAEMRSDRVIATAWDATFTLFDGDPTPADIARLGDNVPYQEAGRISPRELTLARANRSVRLFDHVVGALSHGKQPDREEIDAVGYLMRTTAVYGSGKFGAADRDDIARRPELAAPFQVEMLTVWLIRAFTVDIVEHMAVVKGGDRAVRLDPTVRRSLGVGNSTGLGMAPFLVRHPVLLNNWIMAREDALARVRAQPGATAAAVSRLHEALDLSIANAELWRSEHPVQVAKLHDLRRDLALVSDKLANWDPQQPHPWDALWRWGAASLTYEGQEALLSLMLEPHGELVDDLADHMGADEAASFQLNGAMTVKALRDILVTEYAWALSIDFTSPENIARFWYVSEEKLEPRLGERAFEDGAALEQPLCIARLMSELDATLQGYDGMTPVASVLLAHPEHRYAVRRVQIAQHHPFAEIRDNLIAADMLPIDLLRCKLAFFGASQFDPRSDRWVRINLFQGASYPDEIKSEDIR